MKKRTGSGFSVIFLLLLCGAAFAREPVEFPDPERFPLPKAYEPNVQFWMRVYGEWKDNQMAIHDAGNLGVVFDVVDMPDKNSLLYAAAKPSLTEKVEKIRQALLELHKDASAYERSNEHLKIYNLYKDISEPNKFRNAAENLRVQQGIKERFGEGLQRMGMYIGQIQKVFHEEGVPEEIAYLPLAESSFNNQALSRTRAAGIWQFMSGTARLYMKVNSDVDERLDPIVSSRAAARYLKRSYQMFGSWPVAIMSYNHGQYGIQKAIKVTGSKDFMDILDGYNGRVFGFASRNFYAEFLAACKVKKDAEKYFGTIQYAKPRVSDSVKLAKPLWISAILNHSNLTREDIRIYNPALSSSVLYSKRPMPAGYQLRFPVGKFSDPSEFIAELRTKEGTRPTAQAPSTSSTRSSSGTYVVRYGDTLYSISRKFATTVEMIRRLNGLSHNNIFPGQRLVVRSR